MIKLKIKKSNFTIPSIGNKGTNKFIQFRYDDVRFRMSFDLNKITNEKLRDKQFEIYRSEFEFSNILKANLQDENIDFIFEIFQFCHARQDRLSLRKLALNYNAYHKGLRFGFTTFCFDEYGWLKNENWDRTEVIEFEVKCFHATSKIILGKGKMICGATVYITKSHLLEVPLGYLFIRNPSILMNRFMNLH